MRILKYLTLLLTLVCLNSCDIYDEPVKSKFPSLDNIEDTLWNSYNLNSNIYYDINYFKDSGTMIGYDSKERVNKVEERAFTYTFTPATEINDAIVLLDFGKELYYGGMLIPKGYIQVDDKDVYIIQLYQVDKNGYVLYDDNGKIVSSIMMWKE